MQSKASMICYILPTFLVPRGSRERAREAQTLVAREHM